MPKNLTQIEADFDDKFKDIVLLDSQDGQEMFLRSIDNKVFFSIKVNEEIKNFIRRAVNDAVEGVIPEEIEEIVFDLSWNDCREKMLENKNNFLK
jgi:hypothetical protein